MRVLVTAIGGAAALNTVSVVDALGKADAAWRFVGGPSEADVFDPALVGLDDRPVQFINGLSARPTVVVDDARTPDLVVVPGLDDNVTPSLDLNAGWVPWLRRWHDEGAVVASSCTGAFLLAEAGILDGRQATTHWVAEGLFRASYPSVDLVVDRIVVDEGDVITSGGATTAFNLIHYLVSRFGSHDRARAAAQMMLLDTGRDSQLPFTMVGLHRQHNDGLVHDAQSAIQQGRVGELTVAAVARHVSVSPRTLNRRFRSALGVSPRSYIEEVRVESAKRLLEQTSETVDRIRSEVGFLDPTAFRRAFKRVVGATPTEYRRRFGSPTREPAGRDHA